MITIEPESRQPVEEVLKLYDAVGWTAYTAVPGDVL